MSGSSMYPRIRDGNYVFVSTRCDDLSAGDVVVFQHPYTNMRCIKKISAWKGEKLFLVGENFESQDSRSFGVVSIKAVWGKVTHVL